MQAEFRTRFPGDVQVVQINHLKPQTDWQRGLPPQNDRPLLVPNPGVVQHRVATLRSSQVNRNSWSWT